MKRVLLYGILLGALLLAPVHRADVGKLQPIELVHLDMEGNQVLLATDTGDSGRGESIAKALADMKQTSQRLVYLDTAQYLLVTQEAVSQIEGVGALLKEDIKLCMASPDTDLKAAAEYLRTHTNYPTLKQWKAGQNVPTLRIEKNLEKSKNNA